MAPTVLFLLDVIVVVVPRTKNVYLMRIKEQRLLMYMSFVTYPQVLTVVNLDKHIYIIIIYSIVCLKE